MEENWGNESKDQTTQYGGGTPYGNTMYDNPLGSNEPYMGNLEEPMTMGDWFLTLFLQVVPCLGIILIIYWAFASNVKKSKQNYCRVSLIFTAIVIVLYILLMILGVAISSSVPSTMYY